MFQHLILNLMKAFVADVVMSLWVDRSAESVMQESNRFYYDSSVPNPSQEEDHWNELITVHWAEENLQTVGFPIKQ